MASIQKRKDKYNVVYYYTDKYGKQKQKWESFRTLREARKRKAEVELQQANRTFIAPSTTTLNEFWPTYVDLYGCNKWSISTMEKNTALFTTYISPYLGHCKLDEIRPITIEQYYANLKESENTKKTGKVSTRVVTEVHRVLRCTFNVAVKWEYISNNPFLKVDTPKHDYEKREIWTANQIAKALEVCEDPKLSIAIQLAFACSLRIGEVLGLTWDNVHISEDDFACGDTHIYIKQQLERARMDAIEKLNNKDVLFIFPQFEKRKNTTRLILKTPKTDSSVRKIWLPNTLASFLKQWKEDQSKYKEAYGDDYHDYNLVICQPNGIPCDGSIIRKGLSKLEKEAGLPHVVFHSLRHTSTTYKLKLNNGDIKATQGDTGHSQADMVMDLYSHILDEDRRVNAQKFEDSFYKQHMENYVDVPQANKKVDIDRVLEKIKQDPDLLQLLIATLSGD